jgi:hypothetical protein
VDVSCSGAVTGNILVHGQHGLPAQIEAVTPDTQLVSILIGGNDIDYVGDLLGLSCRDTGGTNCHVNDPDDVRRKMAALPPRSITWWPRCADALPMPASYWSAIFPACRRAVRVPARRCRLNQTTPRAYAVSRYGSRKSSAARRAAMAPATCVPL